MRRCIEYSGVFFAGAGLYSITEILWRGFTHWTMCIAGGVCFLGVYLLRKGCPSVPAVARYAAGAAIICTVEYLTGFIVNLILGWSVWDYSDRLFNIYGQICPLYTILWFLICIPGDALAGFLNKHFFVTDDSGNTIRILSE